MLIACFLVILIIRSKNKNITMKNKKKNKQKKLGINFIIRKIKYVKEEDIERKQA